MFQSNVQNRRIGTSVSCSCAFSIKNETWPSSVASDRAQVAAVQPLGLSFSDLHTKRIPTLVGGHLRSQGSFQKDNERNKSRRPVDLFRGLFACNTWERTVDTLDRAKTCLRLGLVKEQGAAFRGCERWISPLGLPSPPKGDVKMVVTMTP